jgi:methylenetetrahydrofolate dehydrogenase (NADP+)/methenyltetrahydrofolate cyclohydrolase
MSDLMRSRGIGTDVILNRDIDSMLETVKEADFVVTALGRPGSVNAAMIRQGAVVIDGGIDKVDGKVCGDVDRASVERKAACLSPVPGGVGPLTIACLMDNVVIAAKGNGK